MHKMNSTESTTIACVTVDSNDTLPQNSTWKPCTDDEEDNKLKFIVSIATALLLATIMIGIGCTIEIQRLVKHFKNPTGIITGLVCQFIIMPFLGYMWASIFSMEDPETLSVLIVGSCPGGTFSNIVAFWIDGDMELSAAMTTVSIIVSLGMLPLLLYIYSCVLSNSSTRVPFDGLGISIALVLIPLAIGTFIRYKRKDKAIKLAKVLAIVGLLALMLVSSISLYMFLDMWVFRVGPFVTAMCFPLCGMILGYVLSTMISSMSKSLWLSHRKRRTICVEIGIQNVQIAISIVNLAGWPLDVMSRVLLFPAMYGLSQTIACALFALSYHMIYYLRKGKFKKLHREQEQIEEKPSPKRRISTITSDNPTFENKE
ncbi:sodium-dependent organic anion transporter-like [Styela clava]